jgi:Rieske Fe-S protein
MTDINNSRRRFVNFLIGGGLIGWLGSVLYPVFSFLKPPVVVEAGVGSVSAGMVEDIALNSGQIVRFGRSPVLLIRTEAGEFRAFAATCTHLDCIVQYRDDLQHIWCACHNGHYDLQGRNISGPPPRPLAQYDVNVVNDEVLISRRESET